ncbi:MAG TPA: DUF998 domain-containing protein [Gammaproteobacteria bacterium]|jgi:hypothetical membrane protein|nr:DUF998 domain-containing protein [Gammaproteobacteria bacterium]
MRRSDLFLSGPLGTVIFFLGVPLLALMVPGYSHVRQTVSEIGAMDSPGRFPFTFMLAAISLCMFVFAFAIRDAASKAGRNQIVAYLVACMGISGLGVGIFSTPHPLHNVFGMSEIVGYQAPLALALAWKGDPKAKNLVIWSWVLFAALWLSMLLNMSPLLSHDWLWPRLKPVNGLVQRSLFLAWFVWCAIAGILMWRRYSENPASR